MLTVSVSVPVSERIGIGTPAAIHAKAGARICPAEAFARWAGESGCAGQAPRQDSEQGRSPSWWSRAAGCDVTAAPSFCCLLCQLLFRKSVEECDRGEATGVLLLQNPGSPAQCCLSLQLPSEPKSFPRQPAAINSCLLNPFSILISRETDCCLALAMAARHQNTAAIYSSRAFFGTS